MILSDAERVRAALGDLLLEKIDPANDDIDEEAIMQAIKEAFRDQPPLSDDIIAERREGP
jgi:hypothetical protein